MAASRNEKVDELKDGRRYGEIEIIFAENLYAVRRDSGELRLLDIRQFVQSRRLGKFRVRFQSVLVARLSFVFMNAFDQPAVIGVQFRIGSQTDARLQYDVECVVPHFPRNIDETLSE